MGTNYPKFLNVIRRIGFRLPEKAATVERQTALLIAVTGAIIPRRSLHLHPDGPSVI